MSSDRVEWVRGPRPGVLSGSIKHLDNGVVVITCAGGFIGRHLAAKFLSKGGSVGRAHIKPLYERYQVHCKAQNFTGPLKGDGRDFIVCRTICKRARDLAEAVSTAVINKRAGGMGLISGRKAIQKPLKEGVKLLSTVQEVYLDKNMTVA